MLQGRKAHIWFEAKNGEFILMDIVVTAIDTHQETTALYSDTAEILHLSTGYPEIYLDAQLLGYDEDAWWDHMPYFGEQTALAKPQVSGSL